MGRSCAHAICQSYILIVSYFYFRGEGPSQALKGKLGLGLICLFYVNYPNVHSNTNICIELVFIIYLQKKNMSFIIIIMMDNDNICVALTMFVHINP